MHRVSLTLLATALGATLLVPAPLAVARPYAAEGPHATSVAPGAPSGVVARWNAVAGDAALAACLAPADNPLHESRMYAMVHVAVHDSLNAIDRRYHSFAYRAQASADASVDAAVATAAHDVLVPVLEQLTPPFDGCSAAAVGLVEAEYASAMSELPDDEATADGAAVGAAAAQVVLAERVDDGSDTPLIVTDHVTGTGPGQWQLTPDRPFAFAPAWGEVDPFVLQRASQFRPGRPDPLSSRRYVADLAEIKALGGDGVTTPSARTAEQTEIAYFWLESSPLSLNRIARTLADSQDLDEWEAARLLGLLNLAQAYGYIASFDTKYHYSFWRPVTAIRAADDDGNRWTTGDQTWTPLVTTPPIPDHDSAHAVEGGAAAAVFRRFFRTDRITFSACSRLLPTGGCTESSPVLRRYDRFSEAAQENAESRVYVGFHFRAAAEAGNIHGQRIGNLTVNRELRPVRRG